MIPSQLRKRPDRIAAIQKDEKYRETFAGRIEILELGGFTFQATVVELNGNNILAEPLREFPAAKRAIRG